MHLIEYMLLYIFNLINIKQLILFKNLYKLNNDLKTENENGFDQKRAKTYRK